MYIINAVFIRMPEKEQSRVWSCLWLCMCVPARTTDQKLGMYGNIWPLPLFHSNVFSWMFDFSFSVSLVD